MVRLLPEQEGLQKMSYERVVKTYKLLTEQYGTIWQAWMASESYVPLPFVRVRQAQETDPEYVSLQSPETGWCVVERGDAVYGRIVSCYPLTEKAVKALGRVLRQAVTVDGTEIPSTKGTIV